MDRAVLSRTNSAIKWLEYEEPLVLLESSTAFDHDSQFTQIILNIIWTWQDVETGYDLV